MWHGCEGDDIGVPRISYSEKWIDEENQMGFEGRKAPSPIKHQIWKSVNIGFQYLVQFTNIVLDVIGLLFKILVLFYFLHREYLIDNHPATGLLLMKLGKLLLYINNVKEASTLLKEVLKYNYTLLTTPNQIRHW